MIYFKRKAIWKRLLNKISRVKLPASFVLFGFFRNIFISLFVLIAFIYSSYLFLLPKYFNDERVEGYLNNYLKAHSKLVLDISELKIMPDYKFDIKLQADKIALNFPDKRNFVALYEPDIEIDLITLFFNYIDLNKIKTKKIVINTNFTKNNHYDCFDYFDADIFDFKTSKFTLRNIKIICDELLFNLYDENVKKNFKLNTKKLTFSSSDIQKPVIIETQGSIYANTKVNDFKLYLQYKAQNDFIKGIKSDIAKLNYNPLIYAYKYRFYTQSNIDLKINSTDKKNNITGIILFDDLNFVIDNIQIPKNQMLLTFKGEKFKAEGNFNLIKNQFIKLNLNADYSKNKFVELKLNSSEIDLSDLKKISNALFKIFNLKYNFDDIDITGKTSADIYLKSNFKTIVSRGFARVTNTKLTDKKTGLILHDINSDINFENNKINIPKTTAFVDNSKFHAQGCIDDKTNLNLKINSDLINIAQVINTLKTLPLLSHIIPEFNDYIFKSGFVKINAQISGTLNNPLIKADTLITNLKMFIKPLNVLIQSQESILKIEPNKNIIDEILITAKNNIIEYENNKIYNNSAKLKLSNNNIFIDKTEVKFNNIKANVSGILKNYRKDSILDIEFKALLPLNNDLIIIKNKTPEIVANISLDKNKLSIKNAKIMQGAKNLIVLSGNILNYSQNNPRFENLKISLTDRISCILPKMDYLNFDATGDIFIFGTLNKPMISGNAKLYNVICKKYNLFIQDCDLLIKNSNLEGMIASLDILNTTFNAVVFEGSLDGDILNIRHFSADIFQGKVEGSANINIKSMQTNTELILKEISVRHLSSYLKQYSIAVSGRLSALSRLSFTGLDYESALNSLQGYIKFNINNGELAQFAKLERFLQAGNILSQSILKLTLNSIVSSVTKQNTGDFKTIEGTVKITSPMAEIQYINTQGTNMSMHIEGRYNIINNHAILRVLGRIPLNIVSVMGNIGKFSLSQIVDRSSDDTKEVIESLTSSPIEKMMSVYMSPDDKAKIPALVNYQENSPTREFIVIIDGLLNNNNSIKYFKWALRN
ncbi:MAG: hypothetical protein IJ877_04155 [Candidatus Gastranaerophilales bacterium]|nr:hypothetical protein [Candidatus Gastranaerophilales bacterium]